MRNRIRIYTNVERWRVPLPDQFRAAAEKAIEYAITYHCRVILETGIGEFPVSADSSFKSLLLAYRIRWDGAMNAQCEGDR